MWYHSRLNRSQAWYAVLCSRFFIPWLNFYVLEVPNHSLIKCRSQMELSRIHFLEFKNKYNRLLFSYHESYIESDEGLIKIILRWYGQSLNYIWLLLVMSSSRVGSSHTSNWRIFSLAQIGFLYFLIRPYLPRYHLKDLSLHRLARGFTGSY